MIADGKVAVRGVPVSAIGLADVAAAASDDELEVTGEFDGGKGGWSGGTHCAIVDVDVETGHVTIERYVVVEDCGKLINPAVVDGQMRGGVAQGIGAVLLERSAYDDEAQYLSGTFMDYLLPTATDIPRIEIHHLETVPLDPDVNFRGVGEGGMIVSPPTLVNAIEDALSAVRCHHHRAAPAAAADHRAPRQGVTRSLDRRDLHDQRDRSERPLLLHSFHLKTRFEAAFSPEI